MSDNMDGCNDNESKENIYAQQEDKFEYVDFLKSEKFLRDSAQVFGYIDKIYNSHKKVFAAKRYDIYSDFYELFQPGTRLNPDALSVNNIQSAVENILSAHGREENENIIRKKKFNEIVSGVLCVLLQSAQGSQPIYSKQYLENALSKNDISRLKFAYDNIYFSISSRRTYGEYSQISNAGRIIIHLSMLPKDFWETKIAYGLVEALKNNPIITGIKVRNTANFDRADSLLIYTAISAEKAWDMLKNTVTGIIPKNCRSEYSLPFTTPLDSGINANIPIYYFVSAGGSVKHASFTEGIGILGQMAYLRLLDIKPCDADDRLSIFQGFLAAIFENNNLQITKGGVFCQPVRPKKK